MSELVREAEAALASGDLARADRLASQMMNEGGADKMSGVAISGIIACMKKDISTAAARYRVLEKSHALRPRLRSACKGLVEL